MNVEEWGERERELNGTYANMIDDERGERRERVGEIPWLNQQNVDLNWGRVDG